MEDHNYKRYFLWGLIGALSISALVAIFIFLVGDFGETEARLLFTTLSIGAYSLAGLCSSTIQHRAGLKPFFTFGIVVAVLGFLITLITVWEVIDLEEIWKLMASFAILSAGISHSSLLLQIKPRTATVKYALIATLVCIAIVTVLFIKSTVNDFNEGEFYFRILGVFSILNVLGTVATPLLNRMAKPTTEE